MAESVKVPDGEANAACAAVRREVASWPGIGAEAGPMAGSTEFRFRHRVLGHLHPVWGQLGMADLMFSPEIGAALIAEGRADPHPMVPGLGWVTVSIRHADDAAKVIALFRQNYARVGGLLHLV